MIHLPREPREGFSKEETFGLNFREGGRGKKRCGNYGKGYFK